MPCMDELNRLDAKALARAKTRARRGRVRAIRRRTVRGSLALFAVIWAVIFAQLLGGRDPALGSGTSRPGRHAAASEAARSTAEVESPPVPEFEEEDELEAELEPEAEPEWEPEAEWEPEPEPEPLVTSAS